MEYAKLIFYKALSLKLRSFNSIVEKLEFLKTPYSKYKNLPENSITVAFFVEKLKSDHFPDKKNLQLSCWFFKAHAKYHFNEYINNDDFQRRLLSDERVFHIKSELKKILKIEKKAKKLQETGRIDYAKPYKVDSKSVMYLFKGLSINQIKNFENQKKDTYEFIVNNVNYIETLRILDGNYYISHPTEHDYNVHGSPEALAYFRHVLLKNHLKRLLNEDTSDMSKSFSINQVALKYCYVGQQITRNNSNQIAEHYGHKSGEKLFQRFTYFSSPTNRKGRPIPCTPRKLRNKINLLKSVIEILPKDRKARAKDELAILTDIFTTEYQ